MTLGFAYESGLGKNQKTSIFFVVLDEQVYSKIDREIAIQLLLAPPVSAEILHLLVNLHAYNTHADFHILRVRII